MIVPTALFVLASYAGPHAIPDEPFYKSPRETMRVERNHSDYALPGRNRNAYASPSQSNTNSEVQSPQPGRMVVPKEFL